MKKTTLVPLSLIVALGSTLLWAADQPADSPAAQPSAASSQNPMMAPSIQMPSADWTNLKGTVQTVDPTAKIVQIKDDKGQMLQVPLDQQVKIERDGKRVSLSQLQTGDTITLAKRNKSPSEQKSQTY